MNSRVPCGLALLFALSPTLSESQTADPPMPTREDIKRLQSVSDGYVRIVVQSLQWKSPATQECIGARARIDSMAQPIPGADQIPAETKSPFVPDQPAKPITPEILLEIYQRTEENTMARHAIVSEQIYEAVRNDCLVIPDTPPAPPNERLVRHFDVKTGSILRRANRSSTKSPDDASCFPRQITRAAI